MILTGFCIIWRCHDARRPNNLVWLWICHNPRSKKTSMRSFFATFGGGAPEANWMWFMPITSATGKSASRGELSRAWYGASAIRVTRASPSSSAPTLVERFDIESYPDFSSKWSNFMRLVLCCFDAKFCKKIFVGIAICSKALEEIYKIYMLLHRSDLNISEKNRPKFSHFFCKIDWNFWKKSLFLNSFHWFLLRFW